MATPDLLASLATDGVLRRRNTGPSGVGVKISGLDVVEGSVRIYVRSMVGAPGRGLSGAATMTRFWAPSSAGIGMVGERAESPRHVRRLHFLGGLESCQVFVEEVPAGAA